jgi:hypothetical protein
MVYKILGVLIFIYLTFHIYFVYKTHLNTKKYGHAKDFLIFVLLPLRQEHSNYGNYDKIIINKGRIKYVFTDNLYEIIFDFIYQPNKIQITLFYKSTVKSLTKSSTCSYNQDEINKCCESLMKEI